MTGEAVDSPLRSASIPGEASIACRRPSSIPGEASTPPRDLESFPGKAVDIHAGSRDHPGEERFSLKTPLLPAHKRVDSLAERLVEGLKRVDERS